MRLALAAVLVLFSAFTAWILWQTGLPGFFQQAHATPASWQVLVDLVLALTMVLAWIRLDARAAGRAFWPWLVLTLALGSIGPLLYLVLRPTRRDRAAAAPAPAAAA